MLEALIWGKAELCRNILVLTMLPGFPASYGVFQEFYSTNEFAGSTNIAVVGTCAMVRSPDLSPRLNHLHQPTGHHVHGHLHLVRNPEVLSAVPKMGHACRSYHRMLGSRPRILLHQREPSQQQQQQAHRLCCQRHLTAN